MRVLSWVLVLGVGGCVEEAEGLEPVTASILGKLEPAGDGAWSGYEVLERFGVEEPDCGYRRMLVAEAVAPQAFALELKVTEAMSPDADGVCRVSEGGMLRAGERIVFDGPSDGAGALLIDRGDGPEVLGTALFDGSRLTWLRSHGEG